MEIVILVFHILAALAIVGLVLLQHGKGADVGAAFGSGSAGSVFGSSGSANFLSRMTAVAAVIFFLTSLGLTYFSGSKSDTKGLMATPPPAQEKSLPSQIPPTAPAPGVPAAPASKSGGEPGSKAGDVPK